MPSLNLPRGLLRLWVLISIVWILFAFVMRASLFPTREHVLFYSESSGVVVGEPSELPDGDQLKLNPTQQFFAIQSPDRTFTMRFPTTVFETTEFILVKSPDTKANFKLISESDVGKVDMQPYFDAGRAIVAKDHRADLFLFALIALAPPIALFLFGAMILWVVRGFR